MSISRIGERFSVNCIWCGTKVFSGRGITSDDPMDRTECECLVRCPECDKDTKFIKPVGEPPIVMPGEPSDWDKD